MVQSSNGLVHALYICLMGSTVGLTISAGVAFALQGAVVLCGGLPSACHGVDLWNVGVVDVLVQFSMMYASELFCRKESCRGRWIITTTNVIFSKMIKIGVGYIDKGDTNVRVIGLKHSKTNIGGALVISRSGT